MIKGLREKFRKNEKGFTLIEMLIVVAIIAILIAVSIPVVNGALERAREATDAANERSFKAELILSYTMGKFETTSGTPGTFATGTLYIYDAANGVILEANPTGGTPPTVSGYGKSTAYQGADNVNRKKAILYGGVGTDGQVKMCWAGGEDTSLTKPTNFAGITENLIGSKLSTE